MMGFIKRLLAQLLPISGHQQPADWFVQYVRGGLENDTGVPVNGRTIYHYAPYYSSVTKIAGAIGLMPIELKQVPRGSQDSVVVPSSRKAVAELVGLRPNPIMTAQDLKETVQAHAITWGNGRIAVLRDMLGDPVELWPMMPEQTVTFMYVGDDGLRLDKVHRVTLADGQSRYFPDSDVVHIRGLSDNGLVGLSLVELARNSIGGGLAGEQAVNRIYRNDAMPNLVLEAPEHAFDSEEEIKQVLADFNSYHQGTHKAGRVGLLTNGVQAKELSVSSRDAQFLENRKFSREEAALWTQVETMLGVDNSVSYNSLEQRNAAFRQNALARWLSKWEQEMNLKLLSAQDRANGYYFAFNPSAVLRGSQAERYANYQTARQIGLMSQEEIRREEGLPAIDPTENFDNPNTTAGGQAAETAESEGNGNGRLPISARN